MGKGVAYTEHTPIFTKQTVKTSLTAYHLLSQYGGLVSLVSYLHIQQFQSNTIIHLESLVCVT